MGTSTTCVLIVDDEPLARRLLHAQLKQFNDLGPILEASSVAEATPLLDHHRPAIIFLDIHMPRLDGFALLPMLTYPAHIVFVTADARNAIKAFEVEAADYLLKPVSSERLAVTLRRLRQRIGSQTPPPLSTTTVRDGNKLMLLAFEKISSILADGTFTRIHLANQPSIFIRRPISEWESILPAPPFLRADRSTILNLHAIQRLETLNRNETHVHLHGILNPIIVGRAGAARLKQALLPLPKND